MIPLLLAIVLAGPIEAVYLGAYDGDTLTVAADIWPGVSATTSVRVKGVDTPELRGACDLERALAIEARDFLRDRADGGVITLREIEHDKYGGRVLARVAIDGIDVADLLIQAGLGRRYDGGKRAGWCE